MRERFRSERSGEEGTNERFRSERSGEKERGWGSETEIRRERSREERRIKRGKEP